MKNCIIVTYPDLENNDNLPFYGECLLQIKASSSFNIVLFESDEHSPVTVSIIEDESGNAWVGSQGNTTYVLSFGTSINVSAGDYKIRLYSKYDITKLTANGSQIIVNVDELAFATKIKNLYISNTSKGSIESLGQLVEITHFRVGGAYENARNFGDAWLLAKSQYTNGRTTGRITFEAGAVDYSSCKVDFGSHKDIGIRYNTILTWDSSGATLDNTAAGGTISYTESF